MKRNRALIARCPRCRELRPVTRNLPETGHNRNYHALVATCPCGHTGRMYAFGKEIRLMW